MAIVQVDARWRKCNALNACVKERRRKKKMEVFYDEEGGGGGGDCDEG